VRLPAQFVCPVEGNEIGSTFSGGDTTAHQYSLHVRSALIIQGKPRRPRTEAARRKSWLGEEPIPTLSNMPSQHWQLLGRRIKQRGRAAASSPARPTTVSTRWSQTSRRRRRGDDVADLGQVLNSARLAPPQRVYPEPEVSRNNSLLESRTSAPSGARRRPGLYADSR